MVKKLLRTFIKILLMKVQRPQIYLFSGNIADNHSKK